jgi:hypothetical protein
MSSEGENLSQLAGSISTHAVCDTVSGLSKSIPIVFQTVNRHFWFGSDGDGVYWLDGKVLIDCKTENGMEGIASEDGTEYIYFMSITTAGKGDLWRATNDQGVWRYDGAKATHHQVKNGPETSRLIQSAKTGEAHSGLAHMNQGCIHSMPAHSENSIHDESRQLPSLKMSPDRNACPGGTQS